MAETDPFKNQKKLRKAKIITLPNIIKQKIGSGGLDAATLAEAEKVFKENTVDFRPIAKELLKELDTAIEEARKNPQDSEPPVEALIYPAAQFKAQGEVFHFPLVSEISDILINFLETITTPPDEDTLEIVTAHKKAISVVIKNNMTGVNHPQGAELKRSLTEACRRYYKTRKH
jgi:hypothetical protein